jgi:hypothetical protein
MEETVERLKDLESQNERKYRKMIVRQSMPSIRSDLTKSTKLPQLSQSVNMKFSSQRQRQDASLIQMPQSVTLDLNRNELFSRHSIVSQSPSLLFGRVQASPAKNPDILAKAKDMLNYRKRTLATDMRDKYHSVIEKYRKRFQKGYVESLSPPGTWNFSKHETRDMR